MKNVFIFASVCLVVFFISLTHGLVDAKPTVGYSCCNAEGAVQCSLMLPAPLNSQCSCPNKGQGLVCK